MQALGKISPNKGSSTPGIDQETLDKMQHKKINNFSIAIKNRKFQFKSVRRVLIPKPGKSKLRPLEIPTYSDRIVQEAIRIILEAIYEPTFDYHQFQNYRCPQNLRNYITEHFSSLYAGSKRIN
jgi:retron-type reverse transcriptase